MNPILNRDLHEYQCAEDELQHLASVLRGTVAESRRAQRAGECVQRATRSQLNAASFAVSQAIASERMAASRRPLSP